MKVKNKKQAESNQPSFTDKLYGGYYNFSSEKPEYNMPTPEEYIALMTARSVELQNLYDQFQLDMFEFYGVGNNPKAQSAYSLAYEYGHSAGLREVHSYFADLVCLIK